MHEGGQTAMRIKPDYVDGMDRLKFDVPAGANSEKLELAADIKLLDDRAYNRLGPGTREWAEVLGLLHEAANMGLKNDDPQNARRHYDRAQEVYETHLQAKNRWQYLLGMIIGGLLAALIANVLLSGWGDLLVDHTNITSALLILVPLFAVIGSVASVLSRLSKIDLKQELHSIALISSASSKPIVAIFFALVLFYVVDSGVIDVQFDGIPAGSQDGNFNNETNGFYVVTSFLSGFSERFALDIISRVSLTK